jgi:hypothetical protein
MHFGRGDREESRALVQQERDLRAARIAQRRREYVSDFQQIIDQMQRAHEEADIANEHYREVLRLIDATWPQSQVCCFRTFILRSAIHSAVSL